MPSGAGFLPSTVRTKHFPTNPPFGDGGFFNVTIIHPAHVYSAKNLGGGAC